MQGFKSNAEYRQERALRRQRRAAREALKARQASRDPQTPDMLTPVEYIRRRMRWEHLDIQDIIRSEMARR